MDPQSDPDEDPDANVVEEPAEHSRKRPHAPHYSGKSERTLSRQRLNLRKLEAQGFMTLPNFFAKVAEKEKQKAKLDSLVAAAAVKPGSVPYNQQQKESELGDKTTAKDCNSKTTFALHNHKHIMEPSASRDTVQHHGLDGVSTPRVVEINPKPIEAKEDPENETEPGSITPRSSLPESECADEIQEITTPVSCWRSSPIPVEESTESDSSSSSVSASSEDDNTESSGSPSDSLAIKPEHAQDIVARMLEERHRGKLDGVAALESSVLNNTMGLLRDRVVLCAPRDDLTRMVGDKKRDNNTCCRIRDMLSLLNLFLDNELGYTWREASVVVAKSQSHSVARARLVRHWVLRFLQTRDLPHSKQNGTRSAVLQDEDISREIQAALGEKSKHESIKATDLVDIIASPGIQEWFKNAGIDRPTISERTAHRWLGALGWEYRKQKNGMYIDGHEREDVVLYRDAFVQRFKQYEHRFHLWDDNGVELPPPRGFPVPKAAGCFRLILITHDESTFFQNDQRKVSWDREGSSKAPRPKGDGQSLMISDFLTSEWGRLRDDNRCVLNQRFAFSR